MVIYPASGTGAWEAALVNTLSPGDQVLMFETGHFASLWRELAERLGLASISSPATGATAPIRPPIEARLAEDKAHAIKAVCVVHNETSTGVTSRIGASPQGDRCAPSHPALLIVDTISSLASIDYRHDEWGVDVTVGRLAEGPDAAAGPVVQRDRRQGARGHEDGAAAALATGTGTRCSPPTRPAIFPYTPATNLLYGLREALEMLMEEGLDNVFARHDRHAEATRRAVRAWGLEILCANPAEYSSALTAVLMPAGHDADEFRKVDPRQASTCRSAPASASSPARCSASAISATSTI